MTAVSTWVECRDPERCGVRRHRDTTEAPCLHRPGPDRRALGAPLPAPSGTAGGASPEEELEATLQARVTAPQYLAELDRRRILRTRLEELEREIKETRDPLRRRALKAEYKEVWTQARVLRTRLEEYKNGTAAVALALGRRYAEGFTRYDSDRLGDCVPTVDAEPDSREWLEQRKTGLGASDVATAMGWNGAPAEEELLADKATPVTDAEVEERAALSRDPVTPMSRGAAWEPVILREFEEDHPDLELLYTKRSWRHRERPHHLMNVDGLYRREGASGLTGIVECKTSSRSEDWADGVPWDYRTQVLWCLEQSGLDEATVAVKFDDGPNRYYRIRRGEAVDADCEDPRELIAGADRFWERVRERRRTGPPVTAYTPRAYTLQDDEATLRRFSAFAGMELEEARATVRAELEGNGLDVGAAYRSLYRRHSPLGDPGREFAFLDIETTHYSERMGDVIEVGVQVTDSSGTVLEEHQELFSGDPRRMALEGTGGGGVHGITVEDLAGRDQLRGSAGGARIMDLLRGRTMVAHNGEGFERRWLEQELDGFLEERPEIIDTMWLSRNLSPADGAGHTLRDYVLRHGGEYREGHRALNDAAMMRVAFFRDLDRIRSSGG